MSVTMRRLVLLTSLLCSTALWPTLTWALGLGEIHLKSALNEPMNAEIDLLAASPDELTALRATLASREAFARYGIDKPPFLSSLTFQSGKNKDGRDVLFVRSTDAIPEPFVTFLVEVNWARGRLMREYTVLLDPPVYTPGEGPNSAAPVAPATTAAPPPRRAAADESTAQPVRSAPTPLPSAAATGAAVASQTPGSIRVERGDTLTKIARSLEHGAVDSAQIDQTMIALYRANPEAFAGNINVLREGAVLRVPGADQIAKLNQRAAESEVQRQMEAWRSSPEGAGAAAGHLRLVTPGTGGSATGVGAANPGGAAETQALKERVKDLEGQLAESKRLIDIRNNELSALQRKLAAAPATPSVAAPVAPPPVAAAAKPVTAAPKPAAETPPNAAPPAAPVTVAPPAAKTSKPPAPPSVDTGSWIDWVAANWWAPLALLVLALAGLGVAAIRRRRREQAEDMDGMMEATDVADDRHTSTAKLSAPRKGAESFVVEESGQHPAPEFSEPAARFVETPELAAADDTMSSENAVNLDQGDPLAEADFHMAYGLYDQAADLVRIALEREPDRRDLRLKLLEIYFVWGNKDAFLQTAKALEATRDRAPAGEWDKIVIMGKQICPDDPLFAASAGSGRGAGALVDLNLEGGENRVDIDLFGDPEGERRPLDHELAEESAPASASGETLGRQASDHLDFTLDAPERGADESPTREMPPRDEPTVESELMSFDEDNFLSAPAFGAPAESPTGESPVLKGSDLPQRIAAKAPSKVDQTSEVSIEDLGLDLDQLEATGSISASIPILEDTDHASDSPTMVAGMDERSRRMIADAERNAREAERAAQSDAPADDRDLTELERELEASFVAELDASHDDIKTAVFGPDSAPTVMMPRDADADGQTQRFQSNEFAHFADLEASELDSTAKVRGINADSIDLDLDRLATALGSEETVEQPQAAEDLFSSEVFESNQRNKVVDLDVGDALFDNDSPTNRLSASNTLRPIDLGVAEMEPVTMSEVGTKLDLARAYMDMGDPEGARSILEEVVQEGSASQKQEASRLIEALPG